MNLRHELRIGFFAYLLMFLWESWQLLFFTDSFAYSSPQAIKSLSLIPAAVWVISIWVLTDVLLILSAYWIVSLIKVRNWYLNPNKNELIFMTSYCFIVSMISDKIGINMNWWAYSELMPLIPIINTGLIPSLAFLFIPYLSVKLASMIK
ncbi:MAG TPA: hypothetical protein VI790_05630 [Candidatus Nanoarchaeia archaeon]|nr:hypothetical protein [Candidatus Nanoarchaeia archaeon]